MGGLHWQIGNSNALLFFLVECGIIQACIIDSVNILLSKFLVIVGSDTMLEPPSLPLKKSHFWRH